MTDPPAEGDRYSGWSDAQLVAQVKANAGAAGAGASAELTRRLKDELARSSRETAKQNETLKRLTTWLVWLTIVITLLTAALVLREFRAL